MIGNDVVDMELAAHQSNWRRPRFLNKIFTDYEKHLIEISEDPDRKVWDLWSRKEAAYKIINRGTGIRLYNPTAFGCIDDSENGKISYFNRVLSTRTFYNTSRIHTVCCENPDLLNYIRYCNRHQISKPLGYPIYQDETFEMPASVSHHGRFMSCVYLQANIVLEAN